MATSVSGAQLKAARTLLGITQKQVADLLSLSVDTIWRVERDRPGSARTKQQLQGLLVRNGARFADDGSVRRDQTAAAPFSEGRVVQPPPARAADLDDRVQAYIEQLMRDIRARAGRA
jgi:transcriptional regulator with XRE-family HTH domain